MTALAPTAHSAAPAPSTAAPPRARRRGTQGVGMAAPFVVLYLIFMIGPAVYGLVMSFFDTSLVKPGLGELRRLRATTREALQ